MLSLARVCYAGATTHKATFSAVVTHNRPGVSKVEAVRLRYRPVPGGRGGGGVRGGRGGQGGGGGML